MEEKSVTAGPPGVNVIGHVSGNLGLGVAARATVARLQAWGHPVAIVDVDPGEDRGRRDLRYVSLEAGGTCPYAVNLFHMNPPEIVPFLKRWRSRASIRSTNVCVPFWEMPHLPLDWLPVLGAMDLVMAPSGFIRKAIEDDLPGLPVLGYRQTVSLPAGVRPDRPRWGIEYGKLTFLVAFDPLSDTSRKNPSAAIAAFQRAFRRGEDVAMMVKINGGRQIAGRRADRELLRLNEMVAADRRIRLVEERLSYADALSLYASADVMVSLHRAEGLGLHLMEAMSLGKPVIATGWSGNMDFMTAENSCLVGHRLERMHTEHLSYAAELARPEQLWAEPDIDGAAAWMLRIAGDAALRSELGGRAAQAMRAWTAAAEAASPFLAIEKVAATGGAAARMRRRAAFIRLALRQRLGLRLRRWRRRLGSALGIAQT